MSCNICEVARTSPGNFEGQLAHRIDGLSAAKPIIAREPPAGPHDKVTRQLHASKKRIRLPIDDLHREGTVAASECIFCKIVAGTAECHELYRDETTLAFMDIHPANEGHCLVIPHAHFATVFEMSPESFAAVGAMVAKLARAVNETLQPDGLSLVQANGEVAGQTVRHVHVHVLPRRAGDNLLLSWDRNRVGDPVHADPVHLAALATRIRERLARADKGIK